MLEGWANAILNAMGVKTVFPENYSSLCAAQGMAEPFMERSDAEGWPSHLCGYARASVGYCARMIDEDGTIPPEAPGGILQPYRKHRRRPDCGSPLVSLLREHP